MPHHHPGLDDGEAGSGHAPMTAKEIIDWARRDRCGCGEQAHAFLKTEMAPIRPDAPASQ